MSVRPRDTRTRSVPSTSTAATATRSASLGSGMKAYCCSSTPISAAAKSPNFGLPTIAAQPPAPVNAAISPARSGAGRARPVDRGPTRRRHARQGRETGRQDAAAQEVASERVTDPERAQARQRRAPHRIQGRSGQGTPQGAPQGCEGGRAATGLSAPKAIRTLAQRGRRGASRGGRPGSAGQTKGVVSEANETRSASRLLMPFHCLATACGSER